MQRNHGIDVNGEKICALLYADDLLIIGQSAEQSQDLLDSMYGWCRKWKLLINVSKSNIIHFRKTGSTKLYVQVGAGAIRKGKLLQVPGLVSVQ